MLLAHIRVAHWSPSVFKSILREWKLFRTCVKAPIFACAEVDDDKWERFVSRLGFKFLHTVICNNGETRRLFLHVIEDGDVRLTEARDPSDPNVRHDALGAPSCRA